ITRAGLAASFSVRPVLPIVDEYRRTARRAIDRESEYIKAVISADHIVELLWFHALRQIDIGIENALVLAECVSQRRAGRIEYHRNPSGRLLQDPQGLLAEALFDGLPQRLINARGSHQIEDLGFEGMRAGPDADGLCQIVVARLLRRPGWPDRWIA